MASCVLRQGKSGTHSDRSAGSRFRQCAWGNGVCYLGASVNPERRRKLATRPRHLALPLSALRACPGYSLYNVGASYIALNETFSTYNNQTSRKAGGYALMPYEQLNAGFGSTEFRTYSKSAYLRKSCLSPKY